MNAGLGLCILREMEERRLAMVKRGETNTDYVCRVMEGIVAEHTGFNHRKDWAGPNEGDVSDRR